MSDARILYPQFRDEQAASRYPFTDTATLVSTAGTLTIDAALFIDAVFFPIGAGAQLYISSVVVSNDTVTINVGDQNTINLLSGVYSVLNTPTNGIVSFSDAYGRPAGSLVATKLGLANFASQDIGTYSFTTAATEFVASVVIPANEPGVRALMPATGELMTGDIWLVGDQGVFLRWEDPNTIRVDVIGVPLYKRFLCEPYGSFPTKKFLKTINYCTPDKYGNFTITATNQAVNDTVLRVYPRDGALVIDTVGRSMF
jgi:hypothetical protein